MRSWRWLLAMWSVLLAVGTASAQLETVWTATYGGAANDGFRSAIETADGSLVAAGYCYSFGPDEVNIYVVKTDALGDTTWTRALGGAGRDYGYGVCECPGGGYAVAGYTTSSGAGLEDVYVARLDAAGGLVWARTYGAAGSDEGRAVCATSDGGLVVAGRTDSFGSGLSDIYVLKLDSGGDTLWTRLLGGAQYDWAESVCEAADGCCCVCGTTGSYSSSRDILLAKLGPAGETVWQRTYGDAISPFGHDWGGGLCATPDSGLGVAGSRIISGVDPDEIYFLKTDRLGNQTSLKRYYGSFIEYGCSICATPEGGFLICGAEKDEATLKNDLMLVKRLPGANWVWQQLVGGAGSDWGSSVVGMSAPGYYLVAGHTESYGAGGYDGWLLKMREPSAGSEGGSPAGGSLLCAPGPNPFVGRTSVRFAVPGLAAARTRIAVYDIAGRLVKPLGDSVVGPGEHSVEWDGRDQNGRPVGPGIYLVKITAGDVSLSRKVVKTSAASAP